MMEAPRVNSVPSHTARFHGAIGHFHLHDPMPAPWHPGSDMQADVRRQKRLAAARPAEHRPYAMSRNNALEHPQAIQHRPLCRVGGFPLAAIVAEVISMTTHL